MHTARPQRERTTQDSGIFGTRIWRTKCSRQVQWRKTEAAAQDRAGWSRAVCVAYDPLGVTWHKSSEVMHVMNCYTICMYTVSQKNDTDVAHYYCDADQPILIIFDRDAAERV